MNKKIVKFVLACCGVVFCVIALALFAAPFVGDVVTGFDCMENFDDTFAGVAATLALTCLLLVVSIVIGIQTLIKKGDAGSKKSAKVCVGVFGTLAFITFILQCLTIVIMGYNPDYVEIGAGAVASGVFVLLGTLASTISLFFNSEAAAVSGNKASAFAPRAAQKVDTQQLRELKELLDMGALTQEEFEAKKKDLLNM